MGRASLKKQFHFAIESCFSPGADKHSYKGTKCEKIKIFSYETLRYYYKVSAQFAEFTKKNNPNIKYIKNITSDHLQSFVNSKRCIWSKVTMSNQKSAFRVLEKMCNQYYQKDTFNFFEGVEFKSNKTEKIKDEWMERAILDKVIEYKKQKGCTSKGLLAIEIAAAFGLRVSEVCSLKGKDIDLKFSNLHIHESKGKRNRDLPINTQKKRKLCEYIKNNYQDEERVVNLREDSVNQFLRRTLIAMNIKKFVISRSGIHAIRKMVATEEYKELRFAGMSEYEAETKVSQILGHNKRRTDVTNAYIQK